MIVATWAEPKPRCPVHAAPRARGFGSSPDCLFRTPKCASTHSACSMSNWLGGARPSTENPCACFYSDCSQKKTKPCDACSSLYKSRWHWPGAGRLAEGKLQARVEGYVQSQMAYLCEKTGDANPGASVSAQATPDFSSRMDGCCCGVGRRRARGFGV